ncbi:MAG TPA: ABC transporter permease, partial [Gemmataceae bacterium]|nr:ABC transporter permease [Gemmataceae bacterium]
LRGSLVALVTVAALLAAVVCCGVTVSAMSNSTLLGVTVLWILLYGAGFALSLMPSRFPSPDRALAHLPEVLRGYYSLKALGRLVGWSALLSAVVSVVGLLYFSRRDV